MKTLCTKRRAALPLACLALWCAGCANTPEGTHALLDEARQRVREARQTPAVATHAASQLQSAEEALVRARQLSEGEAEGGPEQLEHYAYLAQQQARTALQLGEVGEARDTLQTVSGQRDEILMRARERELEHARRQAARAEAGSGNAATDPQVEAPREPPEALQVRQTQRGTVLTLDQVLFDFARHNLNPDGRRALQELADYLAEKPDRQLLVEGFTDNVGDQGSNRELSQRRAEAVREQLVAMGVPADRVQVQGHGEDYPVASNETQAGRQLNRRVEIVIGPADPGMPDSSGNRLPDPAGDAAPRPEIRE